jgi:hypothetical protein
MAPPDAFQAEHARQSRVRIERLARELAMR